jgi:DNA-binding NarL/FixJ family response regulator
MKVIIVDDQKAIHYILQRMLSEISGVEIAASFYRTADAHAYLSNHSVDLAFMDIQMPEEDGLAFAKRIREEGLDLRLVFVTSHMEFALPAFHVYAYDYILKPISPHRLQETVRRALAETSSRIQREAAVSVSEKIGLQEPLTKRELDVLRLMSAGLTNKQIADRFSLSEGTVKNHSVNIFGKLQVKNRVQAITVASERKLI